MMAAGMVVGMHSSSVEAQGEPNAMALDADPSTAAVDPSVAMPLDVEFDVGVNITAAGTAYAGYGLQVQFDSSRLVWVSVPPSGLTYVNSESHGMSIAARAVLSSNLVEGGAASPGDTTNFTGTVALLRFRCVAPGPTSLSPVPPDPGPPVGNTTTLGSGGGLIGTALAGIQITCGEGPGPAPTTSPPVGTPTPTPPLGPQPTPTPLPPGFEAVPVVAGCNPVASTYPDGTPVETIAGAVGPAGNLVSLWEFDAGTWRAYSPQYPQASDLADVGLLDVVFVCAGGPGDFVRPVI